MGKCFSADKFDPETLEVGDIILFNRPQDVHTSLAVIAEICSQPGLFRLKKLFDSNPTLDPFWVDSRSILKLYRVKDRYDVMKDLRETVHTHLITNAMSLEVKQLIAELTLRTFERKDEHTLSQMRESIQVKSSEYEKQYNQYLAQRAEHDARSLIAIIEHMEPSKPKPRFTIRFGKSVVELGAIWFGKELWDPTMRLVTKHFQTRESGRNYIIKPSHGIFMQRAILTSIECSIHNN
jgi:hypothetical protein